MNPSVYYDLPESVYRADPAISQSALKVLQRSAAHFKAGLEAEEEREESEALLLGRVVSTLVLEPHRKPWWVIRPEGLKFNTKEGRTWKMEQDLDLTIVPAALFHKATRMAHALATSPKPEVRDLLQSAKHREVSVFAEVETEAGKVACKARLDLLCEGNVIGDLKTTLDSRPEPFSKSVKKYGYDIQAASYLHLWNLACPDQPKEVFLFLACEKENPFEAMVLRLCSLSIAEARTRYLDLLALYARCRAADQWPGYESGIQTISTVL